jgi:hypothetical protein
MLVHAECAKPGHFHRIELGGRTPEAIDTQTVRVAPAVEEGVVVRQVPGGWFAPSYRNSRTDFRYFQKFSTEEIFTRSCGL